MPLSQDDLGPVPLAADPQQSTSSGLPSGSLCRPPLLQPAGPGGLAGRGASGSGLRGGRCQGPEARRPEAAAEREPWLAQAQQRMPGGGSDSCWNGQSVRRWRDGQRSEVKCFPGCVELGLFCLGSWDAIQILKAVFVTGLAVAKDSIFQEAVARMGVGRAVARREVWKPLGSHSGDKGLDGEHSSALWLNTSLLPVLFLVLRDWGIH